ncbi:HDIG domain-containing protein [Nodosilinea sp. LEGE 07088]|uniref:HD family phosphohydrolase n=1 Tax=Nodosilinea sp. LEGE 07088 TaxID=2777968 RepID=UPI0018801285|nr:HDIG domain-containing metalloprotein [Nodosilinea sp. LEGE 07088]MBE9140610.1 HDIG domain-containing protein [Nodosilinea sp. LEGE 07088]
MKAIQELVAAVERLWVLDHKAFKSLITRSFRRPSPSSLGPAPSHEGEIAPVPPRLSLLPTERSLPCRPLRRRKNIRHPRLAFVLTVLSLTAILGQRFYNQPGLQVGSIAPSSIFAPDDARVEDKTTTEERRRDARNGALRVLRVESETNEAILRSLNNLTGQVGDVRRQAGSVPFVSRGILSTQVQFYLRSSDDATWLKLRSIVDPLANNNSVPGIRGERIELDALLRNQTLTPDQRTALGELWAYGQRTSSQEFGQLLNAVETARQGYQQALANLTLLTAQIEGVAESPQLFELSIQDWNRVETEVHLAAERMLAQGIAPGLPPEVLDRAAHLQLKVAVPRSIEPFTRTLLLSALEANLVEDTDRTRMQADMAAEAVKPVQVEVQKGELIVEAGDTITQGNFVLLDTFNLSQRRFNYWGLAMFGGLVAAGVGSFLLIERWVPQRLRQQDYLLITAMVVSTGVMKMVGVAAYGLPAIGLLAGSFYGPVLGGSLVVLVAVLLPIGSTVGGISFIAGAAGAFVCSLLAGRMRSREELALLGGGVGLTQGVVYLILTLMFSPVSLLTAWSGILTGAALQGIYGVISSIAALGLSPYLEHLFDLVTPIRLAELSNPNRPMLKRLASEAPGTFQHTVFVSSLSEAAARALGCNVELVRAGTLYHDIGKMHDPQGFIENQMGGPNKHDELNDPWLSAGIIKKHVTEGIVMARRCRLPKAVQAFIPEHQGTMLISYFYHQAGEMAKDDPTLVVKEEDFRYDGPIPQSPETGLVMLADSCEAALRSLTNATPDEALAMVNRILRARWKDSQLVDSGLTRDHMALIAEIFVQVWQQYNHKRIAYPKAALAPKAG